LPPPGEREGGAAVERSASEEESRGRRQSIAALASGSACAVAASNGEVLKDIVGMGGHVVVVFMTGMSGGDGEGTGANNLWHQLELIVHILQVSLRACLRRAMQTQTPPSYR